MGMLDWYQPEGIRVSAEFGETFHCLYLQITKMRVSKEGASVYGS
jgi:hypothetical protein